MAVTFEEVENHRKSLELAKTQKLRESIEKSEGYIDVMLMDGNFSFELKEVLTKSQEDILKSVYLEAGWDVIISPDLNAPEAPWFQPGG